MIVDILRYKQGVRHLRGSSIERAASRFSMPTLDGNRKFASMDTFYYEATYYQAILGQTLQLSRALAYTFIKKELVTSRI